MPFLLLGLLALSSCIDFGLSDRRSDSLSFRDTFDLYFEKVRNDAMKSTDLPSVEQVEILGMAYTLANRNDLLEIDRLKRSDMPDRWLAIYDFYQAISDRDSMLNSLPVEIRETLPRDTFDFQADREYARLKAATYLHAAARYYMDLSALPDTDLSPQANFRTAYQYLSLLESYLPGFKNADSLQKYCLRHMGATALIEFSATWEFLSAEPEWQDALVFFPGFEIAPAEAEAGAVPTSIYTPLYSPENEPENFDFRIRIVIDTIDIGPLTDFQTRYMAGRKIADGFSGDSTYVECFVQTYERKQICRIHALIEIENTVTRTLLLSRDLAAEYVYHASAGHTTGDSRALTAEERNLIYHNANTQEPTPDFIAKMTALEFQNELKNLLQTFFITELFQ